MTGIFQLTAGINGAYNWEYRGGRNDLYNDFDGSSGDWMHNYLPQGDSLGGPSLGWEGEPEVLSGAQVRAELTSAGEVVEPVAFPAPGATRFAAAIRLDYAPVGEAALTLRLVSADGTEAGQVDHTFRVVPAP